MISCTRCHQHLCDAHVLIEDRASRSIATFLFPVFASYKALNSADPALLKPWLMYWVVLACALLAESWTEFILVWYVLSSSSTIDTQGMHR